jgi:hypothetical protein
MADIDNDILNDILRRLAELEDTVTALVLDASEEDLDDEDFDLDDEESDDQESDDQE